MSRVRQPTIKPFLTAAIVSNGSSVILDPGSTVVLEYTGVASGVINLLNGESGREYIICVKSNGNQYTFHTGGIPSVVFPSGVSSTVSTNGKYDIYRLLMLAAGKFTLLQVRRNISGQAFGAASGFPSTISLLTGSVITPGNTDTPPRLTIPSWIGSSLIYNRFFVADENNYLVRMFRADGSLKRVAGTIPPMSTASVDAQHDALTLRIEQISHLTCDNGEYVFIADNTLSKLRKIRVYDEAYDLSPVAESIGGAFSYTGPITALHWDATGIYGQKLMMIIGGALKLYSLQLDQYITVAAGPYNATCFASHPTVFPNAIWFPANGGGWHRYNPQSNSLMSDILPGVVTVTLFVFDHLGNIYYFDGVDQVYHFNTTTLISTNIFDASGFGSTITGMAYDSTYRWLYLSFGGEHVIRVLK
jgi:hypothetical protein